MAECGEAAKAEGRCDASKIRFAVKRPEFALIYVSTLEPLERNCPVPGVSALCASGRAHILCAADRPSLPHTHTHTHTHARRFFFLPPRLGTRM